MVLHKAASTCSVGPFRRNLTGAFIGPRATTRA